MPRAVFTPVDQSNYEPSITNQPAASAIAPRRLTTATPAEPPATQAPPVINLDDAESSLDADPAFAIQAERSLRSGGWPRWIHNSIVLVLAVGSIAALFGIVMMLSNSDNAGDQQTERSAARDGEKRVPSPADESSPPGEEINSIDAAIGITPPPTVIDESPNFFSRQQWKHVWQKVNPYLVRLEIEAPLEDRTVTGLLVDSRGWVATSHHAIADAGRIRVTVAASQLDDTPPWRTLTDDARGIIASDPQHDLALIAINRAQVLSLAEVSLATQDMLVPSQRCLIARVPPPRYRSWLTECRIAQRALFPNLLPAQQKTVQERGLAADQSVDWIIHPADQMGKRSAHIIGSPILDEEGLVVAYHTSLTAGGNVMALPAKHIKQLLDSTTTDQPQPFANASQLQALVAGDTPESNQLLDVRVESGQLVKQLRDSYERCKHTGWTADSADEYREFQSLAQSWIGLHEMARSYSEQSALSGPLEAELQTFMELISSSLVDDIDQEGVASGRGNEWFASVVTQTNPWFIIVADVEKAVGSSPQLGPQPTITLQLVGTDQLLMSPFIEDHKNLTLGKRFLLFGQLDPREAVRSRLLGERQHVRLININIYVELPK